MSNIQHMAFIMDGNRRWAKERGLSMRMGYKKGLESLKEVIPLLIAAGIPYATFFAFSVENWKRSVQEISLLQDVVENTLNELIDFAQEHDVRVCAIGDFSGFRKSIQSFLRDLESRTLHNTRLRVHIAAGYSGKQDILQAVEAWSGGQGRDGHKITEESFANLMQAEPLGSVDLLVRTGGRKRLSNFLLWQCAYAELVFFDTYWPDFSTNDFQAALTQYASEQQNYGE